MNHDFNPDELLSQPLMAHLASSSSGEPRDSPLWFLWEDHAIWLTGNSRDNFPKRLRSQPLCAIGVVSFDASKGVLRHVGIRGVARVHDMDRDRLEWLVSRYLGADRSQWNPWFVERIVAPLDLMIKVNPTSVVARDMSYFKTGPALAG